MYKSQIPWNTTSNGKKFNTYLHGAYDLYENISTADYVNMMFDDMSIE